MSEEEFKNMFIATFLASWCAKNYEQFCMESRQESLSNPPAEDAIFLADEAWIKLEDSK